MQCPIHKHIRILNIFKTDKRITEWKKKITTTPVMNYKKMSLCSFSFGDDKFKDHSDSGSIEKDWQKGNCRRNNEEKNSTENSVKKATGNIIEEYTPIDELHATCNEAPKEVILKKYNRILLIEKYTKYDSLKKQGYKDDYILRNHFSAYISHFTHTLIVNNVINILRTKYKSHVSTLKAHKRNIENISISSSSIFSPDAIFSVGGDGTYLESAHIIANKYIVDEKTSQRNKHIELVGINSDPRGSEGKLCLEYFHLGIENECNYSYASFKEFEKVYQKKKKKKKFIFTDVSNLIKNLKEREKKVEMMLHKKHDKEKIEEMDFKHANTIERIFQNNSLSYGEISFESLTSQAKDENCHNSNFKNVQENEKCLKPNQSDTMEMLEQAEIDIPNEMCEKKRVHDNNSFSNLLTISSPATVEGNIHSENLIISAKEYAKSTLRCFFETDKHKKIHRNYITVHIKKSNEDEGKMYRSINEVYIYEAVKNNICTYINVDNKFVKKLKSTALLITSGTGSTAWAYNVNKIDKKKMKNIINEFLSIQNDVVKQNIKPINYDIFSEYINNSICFHPNSKYMKCIVKEPVENSVYNSTDHIYNCKYMNIMTCTSNTIVYIDGIYNIKIQPNDSVILNIKDDDFIVSYK
ncbi:hypothetical protein, conserved [Plasmodium gonderi]|uniref:NAD(+) kinase n=1 Tax=Plasmodium gonderi TaxID=77519 RepID=A0A1Y1JG61_PLAGO|nr:hypothetical protein, conserved [Plasmodium gonderi]GAW80197.1 hypothetical protein, conserved [Plasmodium gonderi]